MKNPTRDLTPKPLWLGAAMALLLSACGGGGGGDSGGGGGGGTGNNIITLTGVVATVPATANAPVSTKCASGTGAATTDSNGNYAIQLGASATLPCVLEATTASGALHSVTADAGTSTPSGADTLITVKANITPVTELVVAELAGAKPADFYAGFDATKATVASSTQVATAVTAVTNQLTSAGVDMSTVGNVITGTLTPNAGSTAGNAYGVALGSLDTKLTETNTTLAQVVASTATNSNTSPTPPVLSNAASLPADLLLKPAANNCAALRTGIYRVVMPRYSSLAEQTTRLSIDAKTLQVTDLSDNSVETWLPNGDCRFIANSADANKVDVVISQSGVLLARPFDGTDLQYHLAIGFPEQTRTVADLAGTWNRIGREWVSGNTATTATYEGKSGEHTLSATGAGSGITDCAFATGLCENVTDVTITASLNGTDGFNLNGVGPSQNWTDRIYVYKAGGGELMAINYAGDGSFTLWARKADSSAPTDGSTSRSWGIGVDTTNVSSPNSESDFTNGASAGGSYARTSNIDGHPETIQLNSPRSGYNFRAATVANTNTGGTVNVSEFTSLGLRGMGMSALWLPTYNGKGGIFLSPAKPSGTGTAQVASNLLGRASAATCAAARQGTYRVLQTRLHSSSVLTTTFNPATLSLSGGYIDTWTPVAGEACHFKGDGGASDWVVSQAGVAVGRVFDAATSAYYLTIAFPDQAASQADLAGNWVGIGMEMNAAGTAFAGFSMSATLDAAGAMSAAKWCSDEATRSVATCVDAASPPTFTVNTTGLGGFDTSGGGGTKYLYKSGTGKMMASVDADGSLQISAPTPAVPTSAAGGSHNWGLVSNTAGLSVAALSSTSYSNTAWDAATTALTRKSLDDGHVEVLNFEQPRTGFFSRPAIAAAPTTAGGTVLVREFTGINLRAGMGLSVLWLPMAEAGNVTTARVNISVQKP